MHGQNKQSNTVNQAVIELLIFWCHVFSVMFTNAHCIKHKRTKIPCGMNGITSQQVVVTLQSSQLIPGFRQSSKYRYLLVIKGEPLIAPASQQRNINFCILGTPLREGQWRRRPEGNKSSRRKIGRRWRWWPTGHDENQKRVKTPPQPPPPPTPRKKPLSSRKDQLFQNKVNHKKGCSTLAKFNKIQGGCDLSTWWPWTWKQ